MALVEAAYARGRGREGVRDALLIMVLFDPALRVGEALGIRPIDVIRTEGGYRLQVDGKTGPRQAAISPSLVARLQSYAYETGLAKDAQFFPINRHRGKLKHRFRLAQMGFRRFTRQTNVPRRQTFICA